MFNYIAHFPNQCFFLLVVSHSLYSHLSIYLGFLTSEMYCTLKRGTSIVTLPVALVIPLHGYFMIICGFFFLRFALFILHCLCYVWQQPGKFLLFWALPFSSEEFLRSVTSTKIMKFCVWIFLLLSPFLPN